MRSSAGSYIRILKKNHEPFIVLKVIADAAQAEPRLLSAQELGLFYVSASSRCVGEIDTFPLQRTAPATSYLILSLAELEGLTSACHIDSRLFGGSTHG